MKTFLAAALLLSTFGLNFAYGMEDAYQQDHEYDYRDSDYDAEEKLIQRTQADALCTARYNRKLQSTVWLCETNPFYQYRTEDTCLSYCW